MVQGCIQLLKISIWSVQRQIFIMTTLNKRLFFDFSQQVSLLFFQLLLLSKGILFVYVFTEPAFSSISLSLQNAFSLPVSKFVSLAILKRLPTFTAFFENKVCLQHLLICWTDFFSNNIPFLWALSCVFLCRHCCSNAQPDFWLSFEESNPFLEEWWQFMYTLSDPFWINLGMAQKNVANINSMKYSNTEM